MLLLIPVLGLLALTRGRSPMGQPVSKGPFVILENEVTREPQVKAKIASDRRRQSEEQEALRKQGVNGLRQLSFFPVQISADSTICQRLRWRMTPNYSYGSTINQKCFDSASNKSIRPVYVAHSRKGSEITEEIFYDLSKFKSPVKSVRCVAFLDTTKVGARITQSHKLSATINLLPKN